MTTYSYHLDLSESEAIALQAALISYSATCTAKILAGEKTPFTAHDNMILGILNRLNESATMTSWNNFNERESKPTTYVGDCYPIENSDKNG